MNPKKEAGLLFLEVFGFGVLSFSAFGEWKENHRDAEDTEEIVGKLTRRIDPRFLGA